MRSSRRSSRAVCREDHSPQCETGFHRPRTISKEDTVASNGRDTFIAAMDREAQERSSCSAPCPRTSTTSARTPTAGRSASWPGTSPRSKATCRSSSSRGSSSPARNRARHGASPHDRSARSRLRADAQRVDGSHSQAEARGHGPRDANSSGEEVLPIRNILWDATLHHSIHHRGQLYLMCRIAGGTPSGLYGPTRERRRR